MSLSGSSGSPSKDSGSSANSSMAIAETDPNLPKDFSRPSLFSAGLTTSSQHERFSCLGHAEHSLSCMKKYLQAGKLCDVVLIAGQNGKRVSAHRLVLSAASEYFATMFTGSLSNDGQREITLVDINGDILQAVVNYCYTGTIEIGVDNVETLLATASLMLLHEVVEACSRFIAHQLHPSNCLGIAILAEHQSCTSLLNEANAYTSQHFMQVILNKEFLQLNVDQMCNLLSSDDLNVSCEEHIFNALMSWIQHDPVKREKHIGQLLALVRLPFLTPAFLSDEVEQAVGNDPTCQKLIMEAMKWHLLPERRDQMTFSRTKPRKATIDRLMISTLQFVTHRTQMLKSFDNQNPPIDNLLANGKMSPKMDTECDPNRAEDLIGFDYKGNSYSPSSAKHEDNLSDHVEEILSASERKNNEFLSRLNCVEDLIDYDYKRNSYSPSSIKHEDSLNKEFWSRFTCVRNRIFLNCGR